MKPLSQVAHVGIIHPMIFPQTGRGEGPILETASRIVNDEFFGAIEVSWVKDEAVRTSLAGLLAESHMDIIFTCAPPILNMKVDLNSLDDNTRKDSVEKVKKLVDEAAAVNAKVCTVLSGPAPPAPDRGRATELLADSLIQICDYAKSSGNIMITLEGFDAEYEKRCLIGPTADAVALAKAVRGSCGNFGLTIDLSHLPLLHERPESVAQARDYLETVHLGNCIIRDEASPMYGDQHPRFGAPNGENDVRELAVFLKTLDRVGFFAKKTATSKPTMNFEVKPSPGESAETVIASSKRTLLDAWSMLD